MNYIRYINNPYPNIKRGIGEGKESVGRGRKEWWSEEYAPLASGGWTPLRTVEPHRGAACEGAYARCHLYLHWGPGRPQPKRGPTGVDKGGLAPPPNGRAKKNFFVKIEGLSRFS